MKVDIQTQSFDITESIRNHVEERTEATLHNFSEYIQTVHVHLSDTNANKGGIDKHCLVQVDLIKLPSVIVEDTEKDLYLAINNTLHRAGRAVRKSLERKQTLSRNIDKGALHEPDLSNEAVVGDDELPEFRPN